MGKIGHHAGDPVHHGKGIGIAGPELGDVVLNPRTKAGVPLEVVMKGFLELLEGDLFFIEDHSFDGRQGIRHIRKPDGGNAAGVVSGAASGYAATLADTVVHQRRHEGRRHMLLVNLLDLVVSDHPLAAQESVLLFEGVKKVLKGLEISFFDASCPGAQIPFQKGVRAIVQCHLQGRHQIEFHAPGGGEVHARNTGFHATVGRPVPDVFNGPFRIHLAQ